MDKYVEITGKTEEEALAEALKQLGKDRDEVSVEILDRARTGFLGLGSNPAKIRVTYGCLRGDKVEQFLTGLLKCMNADALPRISELEDDKFSVELTGENLGMLIGRRGETLDAIQQLTNYVVNRGEEKRVRVYIDAENYRLKREETLKKLAVKVADKVIKYRKNVSLEPMNAYERHVIHTALQDRADVTTYSTGTEPNRRIIVTYNKGNQA